MSIVSILKLDQPSTLLGPLFASMNHPPSAYQGMHSTQHQHNPKTNLMYPRHTFEAPQCMIIVYNVAFRHTYLIIDRFIRVERTSNNCLALFSQGAYSQHP